MSTPTKTNNTKPAQQNKTAQTANKPDVLFNVKSGDYLATLIGVVQKNEENKATNANEKVLIFTFNLECSATKEALDKCLAEGSPAGNKPRELTFKFYKSDPASMAQFNQIFADGFGENWNKKSGPDCVISPKMPKFLVGVFTRKGNKPGAMPFSSITRLEIYNPDIDEAFTDPAAFCAVDDSFTGGGGDETPEQPEGTDGAQPESGTESKPEGEAGAAQTAEQPAK